MLVARSILTPFRISFGAAQTNVGGGGRWENLISNSAVLVACMGVSLSTFGLTKLAACSNQKFN